MKFGAQIATYNEYADAETVVDLGVAAEAGGWDGVFVADHLHYGNEMSFLDPWVLLSGLATSTERISLGTWVSAVPRRLPWQLARELATLDNLSDGRVILGGGLGAPPADYEDYGIEYDVGALATRFDESLAIIDGLWQDGSFSYDGEVFTIDDVDQRPTPVQKPRIPIVTAGRWPAKAPIRRGARWDGIMPIGPDFPRQLPMDELRECVEYYRDRCDGEPGDVFVAYAQDSPPVEEFIEFCEDIGVTWILFGIVPQTGTAAENAERLRSGPPLDR